MNDGAIRFRVSHNTSTYLPTYLPTGGYLAKGGASVTDGGKDLIIGERSFPIIHKKDGRY